ncbi:MAG: hypothetical protein AAGF95_19180 [Chloroflexota bacterium]
MSGPQLRELLLLYAKRIIFADLIGLGNWPNRAITHENPQHMLCGLHGDNALSTVVMEPRSILCSHHTVVLGIRGKEIAFL